MTTARDIKQIQDATFVMLSLDVPNDPDYPVYNVRIAKREALALARDLQLHVTHVRHTCKGHRRCAHYGERYVWISL